MAYASYENLSRQARTIVLPDIKKGKTLYWIWGDMVMPVLYWGVCYGCVTKDKKFHITCEMRTKKSRDFPFTDRGKPRTHTYEKGNRRIFYADDIGKYVFFTKKEAEDALARKLEQEAA